MSTGQNVYAATNGGYLYASFNYGSSWNISYDNSQYWHAIATSSTAQYVYAAANNEGYLYLGSNTTPTAIPTTIPTATPTTIPTATPSGPSSHPSPAPTFNPLLVSPFSSDGWSINTLTEKLDLHLWVYVCFFVVMFVVLLVIDQINLLRAQREGLYCSSNKYISESSFISKIYKKKAIKEVNVDAYSRTATGNGTGKSDNDLFDSMDGQEQAIDINGTNANDNRDSGTNETEISIDTVYAKKVSVIKS